MKKAIKLIATFIGLTANIVSALSSPISRYAPNEIERLKEKLLSKSGNNSSNNAVLLLPNTIQHRERFLWLAAHGSHVSHSSHASHSSHSSHTSGTSSQSYSTPYYYSPWRFASPALPIEASVIKDVELRTGPSTDYPVITILKQDLKVFVLELSGFWVKAYFLSEDKTITGWLNTDSIK